MYDTYKAIYELSKLKYPDERTNEQTDICTPRAAFAAEKEYIKENIKHIPNNEVRSEKTISKGNSLNSLGRLT